MIDDLPAGSPPDGHDLTVTGRGRAAAVPDVFVLAVAAEAASPDGGPALERAGAALARIRAAALAHRVPESDLAMREVVLRQAYDAQGQPRGLVCELGLVVRSAAVARAGELVAACVEAGGDEARLHGASFEHSDPGALLVAARDAAYHDALARAEQLAALAGRGLGPVRRIVEGPPAWAPQAAGKMTRLASAPLDPGIQDAETTLTITWSFAR